MSKADQKLKRNQDIIKNAAFSFRAEGCLVSPRVQKQAHSILSGRESAKTVIEKYKKAYTKK